MFAELICLIETHTKRISDYLDGGVFIQRLQVNLYNIDIFFFDLLNGQGQWMHFAHFIIAICADDQDVTNRPPQS